MNNRLRTNDIDLALRAADMWGLLSWQWQQHRRRQFGYLWHVAWVTMCNGSASKHRANERLRSISTRCLHCEHASASGTAPSSSKALPDSKTPCPRQRVVSSCQPVPLQCGAYLTNSGGATTGTLEAPQPMPSRPRSVPRCLVVAHGELGRVVSNEGAPPKPHLPGSVTATQAVTLPREISA